MPYLFLTFYKHLDKVNQHSDHFKILPVSHHIWLTNPLKSKEVREVDLKNLKNTISIIDNNSFSTWQHILWTNCKSCIPQTIEKLASVNIEIKELETVKSSLIRYKAVNELIYKNDFGKAADLIREDIVNTYGGFYSDLNYILYKSPEFLMKTFNFFVDAPSEMSLENYMFAASPNHPILKKAITTSLKLLKNPENLFGFDVSDCSDEMVTDVITFGPFVSAFISNANKYDTIDIALPLKEKNNVIDSFSYTDIVMNEDGSVTEIYLYPECLPEEKDNPELMRDYKKIIKFLKVYSDYFSPRMQCTDASFGIDGTDGGTWYHNQQELISDDGSTVFTQ